MNLALRVLVSWFIVSIPFGILLGKALKVPNGPGFEEGASLTAGGRSWMNREERQESLPVARSMELE